MRSLTLVPAAFLAAFLVTCAAPGTAISPMPGDFAFLQVDLRG